jgi:hypothetical protein
MNAYNTIACELLGKDKIKTPEEFKAFKELKEKGSGSTISTTVSLQTMARLLLGT